MVICMQYALIGNIVLLHDYTAIQLSNINKQVTYNTTDS